MALPMIEIDNVSKEYRLGAIGGTTLNAEIQTKIAKLRGKEDPNSKIGARQHEKNERFLALDGVSFSVQPGEAVGIIGHNGAGKSTLLKLISRVTAPSSGEIRLRGRVASMLEVGTGFHPELTGRENVYLNGAILGMTKAEIDAKFDEIVEFAEMGQFIDTPVKRYSSGMYVKLAFSVASHLDSEIMIMDEVLAVGDAKFQNKCLERMRQLADDGRTILYVSHNMNTIRRLCKRVVVLAHGKKIFDGETAGAIEAYMAETTSGDTFLDFEGLSRPSWCTLKTTINSLRLENTVAGNFAENDHIDLAVDWTSNEDVEDTIMRVYFKLPSEMPVSFALVHLGKSKAGERRLDHVRIDLTGMLPGRYILWTELHEVDKEGAPRCTDYSLTNFLLEIEPENARSIELRAHSEAELDTAKLVHNIKNRWDRTGRGAVILPSAITSEERK